MANLTGKVAIVTGSSRGIGQAIAERLGQDGATVVVNYTHSADKAKGVVSTIETAGGKAIALQADMSQLPDIRRFFQEVMNQFDRFDILVNNAGVSLHKPLVETTEAEFDQQFALNAKGTFFALQEAARQISDNGRIVNISTGGTVNGGANFAAYVGSKSALEGFGMCLAKELGDRGITVNAVLPGVTETDMNLETLPEAARQAMIEQTPLKRLGQPADIADVVAFLVSDQARWITGRNIPVDGGLA